MQCHTMFYTVSSQNNAGNYLWHGLCPSHTIQARYPHPPRLLYCSGGVPAASSRLSSFKVSPRRWQRAWPMSPWQKVTKEPGRKHEVRNCGARPSFVWLCWFAFAPRRPERRPRRRRRPRLCSHLFSSLPLPRGGRVLAWRGLRLPCKGYSHRPAPTPLSQRVQLRTVRRSLGCLACWRFTQRLHLYYTTKMVILPWPSEWPSRFLHQPRLGLACLKYSSRSRQHSVVFEGGMSQQLLCVA
jgi:hypothetical protein